MLHCDSRGREPWTKKICLCARESDRPVGVALDSKTDSAHPACIIGSSYGWVVTVDRACSLALLEPLTGRRFPLPPVTSSLDRSEQVIKNVNQMGQSTFHKAALAPGRRLGTYVVMLIHSGSYGLSFLAPDAQCWTALQAPAWAPRNYQYQDVVFHKGAFYTVGVDSELNSWVTDGSSAGLRARLVTSPRTEPVWAVLVESTTRDELLMVSTPKDDGGGPSSWSRLDVSRYDGGGL
ncbi:uncharacterized protein [Aegilops tauschii subsp. strangulata]|uniref:uncharacterized protein n=1 Tax=Aegilops tauschii subsp. strangulata TaxID=200361 RepID=UPI001ABD08DA|nr:uncharacterized protein LOC120962040 [Aegilops tauschii subsp. strangulata]XP_040241788.1 uncharacterized protein LOC120962040 [Aegilops tauschii subsp. strangulata]XP_040241790.1 uncharacterized protein LOC120962040 [Aegilops tauschii subsp. strangulata]XP_045089834.1 uncharacterized protein LOC120962040 [Aegilops tauschii subsp. strangulata]